jgi:hypothetical protein
MPISTVEAGHQVAITCFKKHDLLPNAGGQEASDYLGSLLRATTASQSGDKSRVNFVFGSAKQVYPNINTNIMEFNLGNLSTGSTVTHISKSKKGPTAWDTTTESLGRGSVIVHDPTADTLLWAQNVGAQISSSGRNRQMAVSDRHDPYDGDSIPGDPFPKDSYHSTKSGRFTEKSYGTGHAKYYVRTVTVPAN